MEKNDAMSILNKDKVWNRIKKYIYFIVFLFVILFILISISVILHLKVLSTISV
jgi:hypothetical protein